MIISSPCYATKLVLMFKIVIWFFSTNDVKRCRLSSVNKFNVGRNSKNAVCKAKLDLKISWIEYVGINTHFYWWFTTKQVAIWIR